MSTLSSVPEEHICEWRAYGRQDGTVVCDGCNIATDVNDLINQQIKSILDELDKSMPTAEQLTTKYGYHMPEKQYGYKLALHDIREVLTKLEAEL